jgi:hypothetical protein
MSVEAEQLKKFRLSLEGPIHFCYYFLNMHQTDIAVALHLSSHSVVSNRIRGLRLGPKACIKVNKEFRRFIHLYSDLLKREGYPDYAKFIKNFADDLEETTFDDRL